MDYRFTPNRSGGYIRAFQNTWHDKLVCGDIASCKAIIFAMGIPKIGCMVHAHRKFDALYQSLPAYRQKALDGSEMDKAIDNSLKRWAVLFRYYEDGHQVPIDNNWVENHIRSWALDLSNCFFMDSLRSGQCPVTIISTIQSAIIIGYDPYACLKEVLERLPTQRTSAIDDLTPYNWMALDQM
jgi:hypothetical protein